MDDNRKLLIAALVVLLGGNATGFYISANPVHHQQDPFTDSDGLRLEAKVLKELEGRCEKRDREIRLLENRIARVEFKTDECIRRSK